MGTATTLDSATVKPMWKAFNVPSVGMATGISLLKMTWDVRVKTVKTINVWPPYDCVCMYVRMYVCVCLSSIECFCELSGSQKTGGGMALCNKTSGVCLCLDNVGGDTCDTCDVRSNSVKFHCECMCISN